MERDTLAKIIVVVSIVYFIWLIFVASNEMYFKINLLLSLKIWSIIGIVVYALFFIIEIIIYKGKPKKGAREIKIVSEALKKVACNNCNTTFTISDTGVRPLKYTCPNCGKEGVLKGRAIKGRIKEIVCSNCKNRFEIFDSGQRPLSYMCPNCHFEEVLQ